MTAVSRETLDRLRAYQALLHKWQEKINLISPSTIPESWTRHFEDSLQILPHLGAGSKLYDIGSGAGFPGLVLAIARSDVAVTLIESDTKKCAFLQAVARETAADVTVINSRIETAVTSLGAPDILTARALAPLAQLFKYAHPWTIDNSSLKCIFPKGGNWRKEMDDAHEAGWDFDHQAAPSLTEPASRVLLFTNLRKKPV